MEALSSVHMMRQARLSEALAEFRESQVKSPTASAYLSDLSIFASYLAEAGKADPYVAEIEARDVASFYDREAQAVSQATLRRRLCALRKFFTWVFFVKQNSLLSSNKIPCFQQEKFPAFINPVASSFLGHQGMGHAVAGSFEDQQVAVVD